MALVSHWSLPGDPFLSAGNLTNILSQVCVTAVLAAGSTVVIIGGGIDLSVGSVLALAAALAAGALKGGLAVPIACAVGLAAGALAGAANGGLIAGLGLPPFIATLGTMGIARGLTYVWLGGAPLFTFPPAFRWLAEGRVDGVAVMVWAMAAIVALLHVVLTRTRFGRAVHATGGNAEAARLSGVPVAACRTAQYAISGACAGAAGLLLAARLDSAEPQAGDGYELDAIAAAVMGGASLAGGTGTVPGALLGALVMGVVRNGLNLLNVSSYWQRVAIGSIILGAVLADRIRPGRRS